MAERLPLLGVAQRLFQRALRDAGSLRSDSDAVAPSSVDSAILYPSPSLPMRFAAGTSQSANDNSVQAVA